MKDDFTEAEVRLANRNMGTLLEAMRHDVTPTGLHYLLTHFDVPFLEPENYRLEFGAGFDAPLSLSLTDLLARPQVTMPVTLECAGNGRRMVDPRSKSMPWGGEAVGTYVWTGTPLAPLIAEARPSAGTVEIAFFGADFGYCDAVGHPFARSLTLDQINALDAMVVTGMNRQPLLPQHGAPVRLIVPGWYGMASVKWLVQIEALDAPFQGHQQVQSYNYRTAASDAGERVREIRVNSRMVPPGDPIWTTRERRVAPGPVQIVGRAWSGGGVPITKVLFSDGGPWQEARLSRPAGPYAWTGWTVDWQARPGRYDLMCRAEDANGQVQPLEDVWDIGGLGNNAVHTVPVVVADQDRPSGTGPRD